MKQQETHIEFFAAKQLSSNTYTTAIFCGQPFFLIRGLDSGAHMHGLAVYVKEELPFARDLPLENSADSYLCFQLALLHSLSYFFSSVNHLHLCAQFLILFHQT